MSKILNSWTLMEFGTEFGRVVNRQEWNPEGGQPFHTLSFRPSKESNKATYVHYSSKMGELSPKQLKEQKDGLQIVQVEVDEETKASRAAKGQQLESYKLCRKGELNFGEEVELF